MLLPDYMYENGQRCTEMLRDVLYVIHRRLLQGYGKPFEELDPVAQALSGRGIAGVYCTFEACALIKSLDGPPASKNVRSHLYYEAAYSWN